MKWIRRLTKKPNNNLRKPKFSCMVINWKLTIQSLARIPEMRIGLLYCCTLRIRTMSSPIRADTKQLGPRQFIDWKIKRPLFFCQTSTPTHTLSSWCPRHCDHQIRRWPRPLRCHLFPFHLHRSLPEIRIPPPDLTSLDLQSCLRTGTRPRKRMLNWWPKAE